VVLTGTEAYDMDDEVVVRRRVVVQGNALTYPIIDAEEGIRAFRVTVSGQRLGGR
jgi:hypothetical protein